MEDRRHYTCAFYRSGGGFFGVLGFFKLRKTIEYWNPSLSVSDLKRLLDLFSLFFNVTYLLITSTTWFDSFSVLIYPKLLDLNPEWWWRCNYSLNSFFEPPLFCRIRFYTRNNRVAIAFYQLKLRKQFKNLNVSF